MSVQISIIIVSYNVQAFLEQCLYSVYRAAKSLEIEVFVIDNNSIDDSVEMLKNNFPEIKLICNKQNMGFAYACNQGIKKSVGKYILLLNPDTVIQENTLELCRNFMDEKPLTGALGVRMINGNGKFLPESKRSLPTPANAFYKMFGLSKLFPKSKIFGQYQLQYIDENEIHQVEVLSGAFMFIRKAVLDEIGFMDEKFFMYGEDIDLSFRISKANYQIYYFPKTTIIHYKGESTKKSSIKYVKIFYSAMLIFAEKHYKGKKLGIFRFVIYFAIYLRAALALFLQFAQFTFLPLIDFLLIYITYSQIIPIWETFKFSGKNTYSPILIDFYIPGFIIIWILSIQYFRGYHPFTKLFNLFKAISLGTFAILAVYSLLPENYRYSRALILIGALMAFCITSLNRLVLRLIKSKGKSLSSSNRKKVIIIANQLNENISKYTVNLNKEFEICQTLNVGNSIEDSDNKLHNLSDIISFYKIECVIFFLKDLKIADIINCILKTKNNKLEFKIILPDNPLMVGPQSVINLDSLPNFRINLISNSSNHLYKRILDITMVIVLIPITPFLIFKNNPFILFKGFFHILNGKLTWVSYFNNNTKHVINLPELPKGLYNHFNFNNLEEITDKEIHEINLNYAKSYHVKNDIKIIFKNLRSSLKLPFHLIEIDL